MKAILEQNGDGRWFVYIDDSHGLILPIGIGEKKINARNRALEFVGELACALYALDVNENLTQERKEEIMNRYKHPTDNGESDSYRHPQPHRGE